MDQVHTTISDMPIDNHYMTREFLEKSLVENLARIKQLEEHSARVSQRDMHNAAEIGNIRIAMQEWTLDELENGQITESQAEEIANLCGFDLTKEFEVEVSVTYSMTVNARNEEDANDIVNNVDFDTIDYDSDSISYVSCSIDRIDI
jgi:hypothetical protein